jgi:hypothetical protein
MRAPFSLGQQSSGHLSPGAHRQRRGGVAATLTANFAVSFFTSRAASQLTCKTQIGMQEDQPDFVAQPDFKDVFGHEEFEGYTDVSHLWPRMDSVSDSNTDLKSSTQDKNLVIKREDSFDSRLLVSNVSSHRDQLLHTDRTHTYIFHDVEHSIVYASQYVASRTFSELQSVQHDFDDLQ